MRKILLLAALCAGCATPPPPVNIAALRVARDDALHTQVECGKRYAAETDDGVSDAATVALALAIRCGREYTSTTEAAGALLDNDAQRRMFRDQRGSREARVESFLPTIMKHRQGMKHVTAPSPSL